MQENPYTMALQQVDKAIPHLTIQPGIMAHLRAPQRELTVNFPVEMTDR